MNRHDIHTYSREDGMNDEPGWKKNGRAGPFDWWMGCEVHGGKLDLRCLSCQMANTLNDKLREKLAREAAQSATPHTQEE